MHHIEGTYLKDKEKIKNNIEKTKKLLEESHIGYIESSHNGSSNYIWIEYERKLTDKELEKIIELLSPENSEVDINFSSSERRLPILFAKHWKYGVRELPLNFFDGEKLNDTILSKMGIGKRKEINKGEKEK